MNEDYKLSQGDKLDKIEDIQMRQGICFALSTEWSLCTVKKRAFDFDAVFFPMVSRQRAYNLTFEEKIKKLTDGAQYTQFFAAAEPPSYKFMVDQAKHEDVGMSKQMIKPDQIDAQLPGLIGAGKTFILGMFGIDDNENWGHATTVGWGSDNNNKPRFFDPNQGQFSWPKETASDTIAEEILDNIDDFYDRDTIKDFVVYKLS